jgi:O-antigen chain-terminating methyltransferase
MTDASLFYRRFEDRYRGSRELILERLRGYTPYLKVLKRRHGKAAQALDLGCGRGEWLEVLGEVGLEGRGVDLDAGMLSACEERGFNAEYGDAIAALRSCEEGSLALVSGFHIAEHLEFDVLRELIAEAYRALAKGGMLILETPNPENLRVTAVDFYMDPTHQNPLPPRLLAFAVEFYGFDPCHILRLQEPGIAHDAPFPSASEIYNCASPDFAVLAGKGWSVTMRERIGAAADQHAGITAELLMHRRDAAQRSQRQQVDQRIDGLACQVEADRLAAQQQFSSLKIELQKQEQLSEELAGLSDRLNALYDSRSWKITAPLRVTSQRLRVGRSKIKGVVFRIISRLARSGRLRSFLYRHDRVERRVRRVIRALGIEQRLRDAIAERSCHPMINNNAGIARHAQYVARRLKRKFE